MPGNFLLPFPYDKVTDENTPQQARGRLSRRQVRHADQDKTSIF
jgi:hypothetical protein